MLNTSKEHIIKLLETNDKAVARALIVLTARQTADEQASEMTKLHNGKGFTPADARMGTSMAKFFERRGYLSPKQLAYWRKPNKRNVMRIAKYAGQLLEIAKEKHQSTNEKSALTKRMEQNHQAYLDRVQEKNEFAEYERQQEEKAFMAKMERDTVC